MAGETLTMTQEEFEQKIAEHTAGLKANRDEALKEAKAAKAALKNYDGIDPAEYKALKDASLEAERKAAEAKGDFTAWQKQTIQQHEKVVSEKDAKITKLTRAVERRLVEAKLATALAKAGADEKMASLLMLKGQQHIRVRETDDDFEEYVADERGNPLVADGKGSPMTVEQFVETTLKTQYPGAFKGTGSSGSGAARSVASGGRSDVLPNDMQAFMANVGEVAAGKVTIGT